MAAKTTISAPKKTKKSPLLSFEEMRARAEQKEREAAEKSKSRRAGRTSVAALRPLAAGSSAPSPEETPASPEALSEEEWRRGDVWLTVHVAARRLGISRRRVYTLIYEGRIAAINFGERLWRINERELLRYMAACKQRCREELGLDLGLGSGRADRPRRD